MKQCQPGNAVRLLENGEQYFPALEAAIDRAEREVFLQVYIFEDDETGRRIAAALERAAARGVTVKAMVDGFGSRGFLMRLMPRGPTCINVIFSETEMSVHEARTGFEPAQYLYNSLPMCKGSRNVAFLGFALCSAVLRQ